MKTLLRLIALVLMLPSISPAADAPLTGQLRREQMQVREFSLAVRFNDFTEVGTSHRFRKRYSKFTWRRYFVTVPLTAIQPLVRNLIL